MKVYKPDLFKRRKTNLLKKLDLQSG